MNKKACIIGGTGFVGSAIINRLSRLKYQIKVFSRHPEKNRHLKLLPGVQLTSIDLAAPKLLERHLDGADVVINLAGILNPTARNSFDDVHVELTRRICNAVSAVGVKRFLHMSALHAGEEKSKYLISKGKGQQLAFQCKGADVTIFCPSVIFGSKDSFFNLFARFLTLPGPFLAIGAQAKFQPIWVENVVDAFVHSIENKNTFGKNYSLCGPKQYTLLELIEYTAKVINYDGDIVPLNSFYSAIMARIFNLIPGSPMSLDNYKSMSIDSICDQPIAPELGIELASVESILPLYLGDKETNEVYNSFRSKANRW